MKAEAAAQVEFGMFGWAEDNAAFRTDDAAVTPARVLRAITFYVEAETSKRIPAIVRSRSLQRVRRSM